MLDGSVFPHLSPSTQSFIRITYGLLIIATLVQSLPHARRFFVSERWGGYAERGPGVDWLQNPFALPLVLAAWFGAAFALVLGWWVVPAALVNGVLCRYFFIHMRWRGLLRGMGAPGFIANWLGLAVILLDTHGVTRRICKGSRYWSCKWISRSSCCPPGSTSSRPAIARTTEWNSAW